MFCTIRLDTYVDVNVCIYVYQFIYIYTYLICIWYWLIQFVIWHHLHEMLAFWVRDVNHVYIPSFIRWLIAFVIVHFAYMILAWLVYMSCVYMSCLHDSFVLDIINDACHTETAAPMTAHWDGSIGIDSSYMKLTGLIINTGNLHNLYVRFTEWEPVEFVRLAWLIYTWYSRTFF